MRRAQIGRHQHDSERFLVFRGVVRLCNRFKVRVLHVRSHSEISRWFCLHVFLVTSWTTGATNAASFILDGGSCQMSNLQILRVTCHRRKTVLECKKIRCINGHRINLEPGVTYIACSDIDDPDYEVLSKNPKDALSNRDGLFRLIH